MSVEERMADAPRSIVEEIDVRFTTAAIEAGVLPTVINRFQLMPRQDGIFVLALGGVGAAALPNGKQITSVHLAGAFAINRELAADLAIGLPFSCGLSDEEIDAAYKRNPHVPRK